MSASHVMVATRSRSRAADFIELLKFRLVSLVLFTTAVGYVLGWVGSPDGGFLFGLLHTILGTALVAGSAMTLNQFMERHTDARMDRTMGRPLPSGRVTPTEALLYGAVLAVVGMAYLAVLVNSLAAVIAALTLGSYLFAYTPLKTRTPLCTLVGAVPGALPPVLGYVAAGSPLDVGAWVLFAILFVWQLPHFLAIAWLYREDYARGGQMMLPVVDADGWRTAQHIVLFAVMLLPTALLPAVTGMAGMAYAGMAILLGLAFLAFAARLAWSRSRLAARAAFLASVVYLPILLAFLITDGS